MDLICNTWTIATIEQAHDEIGMAFVIEDGKITSFVHEGQESQE